MADEMKPVVKSESKEEAPKALTASELVDGEKAAAKEQKEAAREHREADLAAADKIEKMWVESGREDDSVVLFERDDAHPDGEAFVGGRGIPEHVARTAKVEAGLESGELIESHEPEKPKDEKGKE